MRKQANFFTYPIVLLLLSLFFLQNIKSEVILGAEKENPIVANTIVGEKETEDFKKNEIIVKLKSERVEEKGFLSGLLGQLNESSLDRLNKREKSKKFEQVLKGAKAKKKDLELLYKVEFQEDKNIKELIKDYKKDPNVEYAQPNYRYKSEVIPNDPSYGSLWGMPKIDAPTAWDTTTGSSSVVVAVVDTGVDYNHEDLSANMWVNPDEIAANGLDDDGNGKIDDVKGWDFVSNDNDPMDDHNHGTHVSGTIAGVGNNGTGVVGVTWSSKIMPLKFLGADGYGYTSDGISAINYAVSEGADVINNSWGGSSSGDPAVEEAINSAHDANIVVVSAAGNANQDAIGHSPAYINSTITVASSTSADAKSSFSNYGGKIDVAAPGSAIYSTTPSNTYSTFNGTSMATPHVAGLAALLLAADPTLNNEQIRQIIRKRSDDLGDAGFDTSFGYGRIDANQAILNRTALGVYISSPTTNTATTDSFSVFGSITGSDFRDYKVEYGSGHAPTSWTEINTGTSSGNNIELTTSFIPDNVGLEDKYTIRVTAYDNSGTAYEAKSFLTNDNVHITTPAMGANETFKNEGSLAIVGRAVSYQITNFVVEHGVGESPVSWSSTGITYPSGNSNPIDEGTLANLDLSVINSSDTITLRVTVTNQSAIQYSATTRIKTDLRIRTGWPKPIDYGRVGGSPIAADVNSDGIKEIIYAVSSTGSPYSTYPNKLHVVDQSGNNITGFPKSLDYVDVSMFMPIPAPSVGDIDGNGDLEIVVMSSPKVYIFNHDGTALTGWPITGMEYNSQVVSMYDAPPIISDLDYDGKSEVIIKSTYRKNIEANTTTNIYVYNFDGTLRTGWPKQHAFGTSNSVAVGDMDNDGSKEIVLVDHNGEVDSNDYILYVWKEDGTNFGSFPKILSGFTYGSHYVSPVLADFDSNGSLDIFFAGTSKFAIIKSDGEYMAGWPVTVTTQNFYNSPAIADIDNDGDLDIVLAPRYGHIGATYDGYVTVYDHTGVVLTGWPWDQAANAGYFYASPVVADIDADGAKEVLIASSNSVTDDQNLWYGIHVLSNTGVKETFLPTAGNTDVGGHGPIATPLIDNLDDDADFEVFTSNFSFYKSWMYIYDLDGSYSDSASSWPGYQNNNRHTGLAGKKGEVSKFESSVRADKLSPATNTTSTITIKLMDVWGNPISGKNVSISATGTGNSLTQPSQPTDASGVTTAAITSTDTGTKTVTVTNTTDSMTIKDININFFNVDHLDATYTANQAAGTQFSVTVQAKDDLNANVAGYGGTVNITSSDAQAVLPTDNGTGWSDGGKSFNITLKTAGAQTVTFTDGGLNVTANLTVAADSLDHVDLTPSTPQTITAGQTVQFTAQGKDQYNNNLPVSYTWENTDGAGLFSETTAAVYQVRATSSGIQSSQVQVTVQPGAVNTITITPSTTQYINGSGTVQFSATGFDQYSNQLSSITPTWVGANSSGLFGPSAGGTYQVKATSGLVESSETQVVVDTTSPNLSQSQYTTGDYIAGTKKITFTATDNDQIANVKYYLNNVLKETDSSAPFEYVFDTYQFSNGLSAFKAVAQDRVGNSTELLLNLQISNYLYRVSSPGDEIAFSESQKQKESFIGSPEIEKTYSDIKKTEEVDETHRVALERKEDSTKNVEAEVEKKTSEEVKGAGKKAGFIEKIANFFKEIWEKIRDFWKNIWS